MDLHLHFTFIKDRKKINSYYILLVAVSVGLTLYPVLCKTVINEVKLSLEVQLYGQIKYIIRMELKVLFLSIKLCILTGPKSYSFIAMEPFIKAAECNQFHTRILSYTLEVID